MSTDFIKSVFYVNSTLCFIEVCQGWEPIRAVEPIHTLYNLFVCFYELEIFHTIIKVPKPNVF